MTDPDEMYDELAHLWWEQKTLEANLADVIQRQLSLRRRLAAHVGTTPADIHPRLVAQGYRPRPRRKNGA